MSLSKPAKGAILFSARIKKSELNSDLPNKPDDGKAWVQLPS